MGETLAIGATWAFGGALNGPRNAILSVANACGHPHCGAPYGATKRCTGCGGRMWPPPLGP
eukprot:8395193-Pyramimonas_sp.AAC.1